MMPELTEERKHLIAQLKGEIAHKTGKEKEEAYRKYWEAEHGKPMPICNLPITSRLRYHCATRAPPLEAFLPKINQPEYYRNEQ